MIDTTLPLAELEDYEARPPRSPYVEVDREVCEVATCNRCGHDGLEYRPFCRPGSYRAFAVCPECGNAEEF